MSEDSFASRPDSISETPLASDAEVVSRLAVSYLEHESFSNPSPVPLVVPSLVSQSTLDAIAQPALPDPEDVAESLEVPSEGVTGDPEGFLLDDGPLNVGPHEAEETARAQVRALIERTKQMRPTSDADLLMRAYAFANEKHDGQKRMTGEPYIEHPIAVAGILAELGMDDPTIAAGLLHDVPEDCGVTPEEMQERFGPEVANLVDGVTKLKRIDFTNKQEKQAENLRKLFLAMAGDVRVIIIKLADRLHNMRTLDPFPENRKREIAAETLHILAPIAHRLGIWRVKWELEDRSFKYLEPQLYKQIYAKVQRTRAERSKMVQTAIVTLTEKLRSEGIEAEVTGRPKHFYSIYQKMIKQGLQFDAIHDLIALRVICNAVPDCYHALGVVHSLWMQVPDMFFDYIAKPKPNNYQSLHTKVLGFEGDLIEVQIRTREMHREAEFGIAAHWRYKEDGDGTTFSGAADIGSKLRWLRLVLELQSDTQGDAQSFLDSLKLDLATDQIFAFTPRGDVIYLPQGSTPVDFAYRVHSEVGNSCVGAKVNGRIVPLNYKLHNGDISEIITSRGSKGPKRGWLDFVVTPHAKNRIKSFLKKQNFDDNYREGLQRLEKAAQAERLKLGSIATSEVLLRIARALKFKNVPDLIAAIGYGEYSPENIFKRVRTETGKDQEDNNISTAGDDSLSSVATTLLQRRPRLDESTSDAIQQGTLQLSLPISNNNPHGSTAVSGNFLYSLAKCCAPIPGDEVKGYVTRGRGVTVHRIDCSNLKHYQMKEPDRLLNAHWTEQQDRPYQALIAIESNDRTGLLAEVTALFAERHVNISAVNTYPLKNNRARLNIAATIRNSVELEELMSSLRNVVGVSEVHRV
jgi:GTP pyrophosphokinase